jgi:Lrp/AsnC family leucine-responsive transcriptional regulator
MRLDEIDVKILNTLQTNGKITNVQLANLIGLSPAPTLERVKKLEQADYITGYHARLDPEKLGLSVIVFIEVGFNLSDPASLNEFIENVKDYPEVTECYHITGEYDLLLKIYAPSVTAYQSFIMNKLIFTRYVSKVNTKVVLNTAKYATELPLANVLSK